MPLAEEQLLEHAAFLRRLVSGLVLDANRVDDVVQETYLRALSQSPRHARNVRGWLAAIARNLAYRLHRDPAPRAARDARPRPPRPAPPVRCTSAARCSYTPRRCVTSASA